VLSLAVLLLGEYGQRGVALAVPCRVARGRLDGIVEPPLDPVDRVALDNAARR
jgi:malate/lactate dehydrogenase